MRILFFLVVSCFLVFCNQQENGSTQTEPARPDSIKAFILKTDLAKKNISFPGDLISLENVQIRAKISGYIRKLNVDIGSKVKKGQVLAVIDAPEINSQI